MNSRTCRPVPVLFRMCVPPEMMTLPSVLMPADEEVSFSSLSYVALPEVFNNSFPPAISASRSVLIPLPAVDDTLA